MTDCIKNLFKKNSKWINIYQGIETVDDPFEKNTTVTYINPKSIRALISDLTFAKIKWSMPGVITSRAKIILIEKRYLTLLENSQMIEIKTDNHSVESYEGWRENSKLQYKIEGDYIRAYIYSKHI